MEPVSETTRTMSSLPSPALSTVDAIIFKLSSIYPSPYQTLAYLKHNANQWKMTSLKISWMMTLSSCYPHQVHPLPYYRLARRRRTGKARITWRILKHKLDTTNEY